MADCWAERLAVKRVGPMAASWVDSTAGQTAERMVATWGFLHLELEMAAQRADQMAGK